MENNQKTKGLIKSIEDLQNPFARAMAKLYKLHILEILYLHKKFYDEMDKYTTLDKEFEENIDIYIKSVACNFILAMEIENSSPLHYSLYSHFHHQKNKITGAERTITTIHLGKLMTKNTRETRINASLGFLKIIYLFESHYKKKHYRRKIIKKLTRLFVKKYHRFIQEKNLGHDINKKK